MTNAKRQPVAAPVGVATLARIDARERFEDYDSEEPNYVPSRKFRTRESEDD
jgi:hypothetical protein